MRSLRKENELVRLSGLTCRSCQLATASRRGELEGLTYYVSRSNADELKLAPERHESVRAHRNRLIREEMSECVA